MPIDKSKVPHYVLVLNEEERFALGADKQLFGEPTDALVAFAERNGLAIPPNVTAWDRPVRDLGIDPTHRNEIRCYLLVRGGETDEELQRLIDM